MATTRTHSERYRRAPEKRREISVREALAVLRDASKDSKVQRLVKSLDETIHGPEGEQRDKANTQPARDTPGSRSAAAADTTSTADARD